MFSQKLKRAAMLATVMLLTVALLLACGQKKTGKQLLQESFEKSLTVNSYSFNGDLKFEMGLPDEMMQDPQVAMVANLFKNMELKFNGAYQNEPLQTETQLDLQLKGDMNLNLSLPVVFADNKTYVKVPQIPFLPIPPSVTGKFLVLDPEELNKLDPDNPVQMQPLDPASQQELGRELMNIFTKHFDETAYFKLMKTEEAALPSDVQAEHVVEFAITSENADQALTTILDNVAPEVLDVLSNPKWVEKLQLDAAQLQDAKKQLVDNREQTIEDIKKALQINSIRVLTAIDGDGYTNYQSILFDVTIKDENGQSFDMKITLNMQMNDFNQPADFKIGIPGESDVITFEQLMQAVMTGN